MRVTYHMLSRSVLADMTASSQRLLDAQKRASSGKQILKPSDDVSGTGRALNLRSTLSDVEQYLSNTAIVRNQLSVTTTALDSVVKSVQQVRSIALQGANSSVTAEARQALASQLGEISKALAGTANTQLNGKYIFSGSMASQQPLIATGATPPYTYAGNDVQVGVQVSPWTTLGTNVTANAVFNMDGTTMVTTSDLFTTIQDLKDKVLAGDCTGVSDMLDDIDLHLSNVTTIRSEVGGRIATLESTSDSLLDSKTSLGELLSKTEDADLAEAILDLQTRQYMYEAAVSTAGKMLQLSLTDFLK